jgi:hypothetical protein
MVTAQDLISKASFCIVCGVSRPVQRWTPAGFACVRGPGGSSCLTIWRGSEGWEALADPAGPRAWCPEHKPSASLAGQAIGSKPNATVGVQKEAAT